jgi:thiol-disulfide isomerase/thioredoxin
MFCKLFVFSILIWSCNNADIKQNVNVENKGNADSVIVAIKAKPFKSAILNIHDKIFNNYEIRFINNSDVEKYIYKTIPISQQKMVTHLSVFMQNPDKPITYNHAIILNNITDTIYFQITDSSNLIPLYFDDKNGVYLDSYIETLSLFPVQGAYQNLLEFRKVSLLRLDKSSFDLENKKIIELYIDQAFYYAGFNMLAINNVTMPTFIEFLGQFEKYLIKYQDIITTNSQLLSIFQRIREISSQSLGRLDLSKERYNFINIFSSGKSAKIFGAYLLHEIIWDNIKSDSIWQVANKFLYKNPFYFDNKVTIDSILNTHNQSSYLSMIKRFVLINASGERTTLDSLLLTSSKNYFLIDFWATWCKPCINEDLSLGRKIDSIPSNVQIIKISLDKQSDYSKWKKMSLGKQYSYITLYGFEDPLCHYLNINAIPRFVVIDNNGKLINDDFQMPSNDDFIHNLNTLNTR